MFSSLTLAIETPKYTAPKIRHSRGVADSKTRYLLELPRIAEYRGVLRRTRYLASELGPCVSFKGILRAR